LLQARRKKRLRLRLALYLLAAAGPRSALAGAFRRRRESAKTLMVPDEQGQRLMLIDSDVNSFHPRSTGDGRNVYVIINVT
jgi:hypothetical protein